MNQLVHADIFFFVTTIAVIVLSLITAIAIAYVVLILREVHAIAQNVRKASDQLEHDFEALRTNVITESLKAKAFASMIISMIARMIPQKKSRKKHDDES